MPKELKVSQTLKLMKAHSPDGSIVEIAAPYCTPEEWAERTSMDVEVVRLALYNRRIARHQFPPRVDLFVNVVEETRRILNSQHWN